MADDRSPASVFAALDDDRCRDILVATLQAPMTAPELAARCEGSRSTVYRKLRKLRQAGLVDDDTRFRPGERNVTEYRASVESLSVTITADGVDVKLGSASVPESLEER